LDGKLTLHNAFLSDMYAVWPTDWRTTTTKWRPLVNAGVNALSIAVAGRRSLRENDYVGLQQRRPAATRCL